MIAFLIIVVILAILWPSNTRNAIDRVMSIVGWTIIILFAMALIGLLLPVA
jgi:hypothetical protein